MFADLHLHTHYSDGTYTPDELAQAAVNHGLQTIALTDHDTVEACDLVRSSCQARHVEFIDGVELTSEYNGHELHLLAYFIDLHNKHFQSELARFQEARQNRVREIVARLNHFNVGISASDVLALANCKSPGRPHIARVMVQGGYCKSLDEAFERFLKKHRPAWVPKYKMSAPQAIDLIHEAGGLAVVAHPGINHCDDAIPELVTEGLDGLECFHSKHTRDASQRYVRMADELNLLITGGSDCHGMSKGKPTIGQVKLPLVYVERLCARHAGKMNAAKASPAESTVTGNH